MTGAGGPEPARPVEESTGGRTSLELARTVADAVLYEGYLLYPYRATSSKNRVRWQFGVLGPQGASAAGLGEESDLSAQCLLRERPGSTITVALRFLQLQTREVQRADGTDFTPVEEFRLGDRTWLTWDETTEHEVTVDSCAVAELRGGREIPVEVPGGAEYEEIRDDTGRVVARVVRRREHLSAVVRLGTAPVDGLVRLSLAVTNTGPPVDGTSPAIRTSLIGTHLLLRVQGTEFVSLLEPPPDAAAAAADCRQHRCWPVLAGSPGDRDVVLASPIILYDHPEVAQESAGALFDSTEIDEILTLRVMTLTDEEKAAARATDPRAAAIIDRCEQMSPEDLQRLHGVLRDPHAGLDPGLPDPDFLAGLPTLVTPTDGSEPDPALFGTGDAPWWDPAADASVAPEADVVIINGVGVAKDSLVRVHPSRRADAQDMFFAGQTARVSAVLSDVDGNVHVAVVLVDDPAAEMHDWYGRYLYFAPEELEPLGA